MGGWVGRDEKEDKNNRKRMLKCGVGLGKNKNKKWVQLGREVGEERGERRDESGERRGGEGIKEGSLRM